MVKSRGVTQGCFKFPRRLRTQVKNRPPGQNWSQNKRIVITIAQDQKCSRKQQKNDIFCYINGTQFDQ